MSVARAAAGLQPAGEIDSPGRVRHAHISRWHVCPSLRGVLALKVLAVVACLLTPWKGVAVILFFGGGAVMAYHVFVPSAQGLCRVRTRFVTDRDDIWLTIDDGPDPHDTPQILDLLERHEARATFFVIGERAARWPELIAEIRRRGHEVAHHTHTHPAGSFWCASLDRVDAELDRALAVFEATGTRPRYFRPPVGIKHLFLGPALARRGLRCIGWSIRSGDRREHRAEAIVEHVMRRLHPGAILLVHEGRPAKIPAPQVLAPLLERLAMRRYRCVIPSAGQLA